MRSTMPFFDSALYRKTMARFWPLWAGWTLLLTFLIPVQLVNHYFDGLAQNQAVLSMPDYAVDLPQMASAMALLQMILCVVCAMAAFSYLYNNRSACMMHALPMRREKLFGTQYLAGVSMVILPELVVSVLTVVLELALLPSETWGMALRSLGLWLLAVLAQAVAFYSIAVFCAMFTGHILALPVFYGVVNYLVTAVCGLVQELCSMFLYGFGHMVMENGWILKLTPAAALADASRWTEYYDGNKVAYMRFESAKTLAAYAAAGVVLTVLALLIYRRRHVESAGDVVAVPLVRPLFRWGVALCCGLFFGSFCGVLLSFGDPRLFLSIMVVLWTLAGYLAAEMLLKKSFHIFKGCWKGASAAVALSVLLCAGCYFDWMGVETRVPEPDQVADLIGIVDMGTPWDSGREVILGRDTDSQHMREKVLELHRAVVADLEKNGRPERFHSMADNHVVLDLNYELKNGRRLSRHYYLPIYQSEIDKEGTLSYAVQQTMLDQELTEAAYDFAGYEADGTTLMAVELNYVKTALDENTSLMLNDLTGTQRSALWKAVRQDFQEGKIGVRWAIDDSPERRANTYRTDLNFYFQFADDNGPGRVDDETAVAADTQNAEVDYDKRFTITLTPHASHTLDLLREYGAWDQCEIVPWG